MMAINEWFLMIRKAVDYKKLRLKMVYAPYILNRIGHHVIKYCNHEPFVIHFLNGFMSFYAQKSN